MKEIEVKILEIDRPTIESKLDALGAEKEFENELYAIIFDDAEGSIKAAGNLLRLRREGVEVRLTHKQTLGSGLAKQMEEREVVVSDFEEMRSILKAMGYHESLTLRKTRAQWKLPQGHVVLDNYHDELAHIPEFLELEATNEADIKLMLEKLGYTLDQALPWTTRDLMVHYGPKK